MTVPIMIRMMIVTWFKVMALVVLEEARLVIRRMVVRVGKSCDILYKLYFCLLIVSSALWFA